MLTDSTFADALTAVGLFVLLTAGLELWFFIGRRVRRRRGEALDQLANIQGATLGLLALLLGFSFALAAGRFGDRVQLIVQESNAIGTAWLRCDLLPPAERDAVRTMMRQYVAERVKYYDEHERVARQATLDRAGELQAAMWPVVAEEARRTPLVAGVLLPAFNEMFDVQATRTAAAQRHMPGMLLLLLLASSLVSVAAVGYGCGVAGKRNIVLTTALVFLISGALWAIIDMDHPRKGLIRAGQQPLLDLQKNIQPPAAGK